MTCALAPQHLGSCMYESAEQSQGIQGKAAPGTAVQAAGRCCQSGMATGAWRHGCPQGWHHPASWGQGCTASRASGCQSPTVWLVFPTCTPGTAGKECLHSRSLLASCPWSAGWEAQPYRRILPAAGPVGSAALPGPDNRLLVSFPSQLLLWRFAKTATASHREALLSSQPAVSAAICAWKACVLCAGSCSLSVEAMCA